MLKKLAAGTPIAANRAAAMLIWLCCCILRLSGDGATEAAPRFRRRFWSCSAADAANASCWFSASPRRRGEQPKVGKMAGSDVRP